MAIECLVITLIFGIIIFSFAQADRIKWIIATIPLSILPCLNGLTYFISENVFGCQPPKTLAIIVIFVSILASGIWIGIASFMFKSNRFKLPYITVGIAFNLILGLILVFHNLSL